MKALRFLSATLMSLGFSAGFSAFPALAFPEISSGDGIINADIATCLNRTDAFVDTLNVSVERGDIVRTGYFRRWIVSHSLLPKSLQLIQPENWPADQPEHGRYFCRSRK